MQHREAKSPFSLLTLGGAGLDPEAVPRPACGQSHGCRTLAQSHGRGAAHISPATRGRQARRALHMQRAARALRWARAQVLPGGRAGLPPETQGQQPSRSARRLVPRETARAPRLTTTLRPLRHSHVAPAAVCEDRAAGTHRLSPAQTGRQAPAPGAARHPGGFSGQPAAGPRGWPDPDRVASGCLAPGTRRQADKRASVFQVRSARRLR